MMKNLASLESVRLWGPLSVVLLLLVVVVGGGLVVSVGKRVFGREARGPRFCSLRMSRVELQLQRELVPLVTRRLVVSRVGQDCPFVVVLESDELAKVGPVFR